MASEDTVPRHSSTIVSQAMPAATCSKTSATRIRVPRNVGWPWQIVGSATMNRPIIRLTNCCLRFARVDTSNTIIAGPPDHSIAINRTRMVA